MSLGSSPRHHLIARLADLRSPFCSHAFRLAAALTVTAVLTVAVSIVARASSTNTGPAAANLSANDVAEGASVGPSAENTSTESQDTTHVHYIHHPLAKEGLIRITKDKVYEYKLKTSPQNHSASLRYGVLDPQFLKNPDNNIYYDDYYLNTPSPYVMFDYEWQFWHGHLGKFGFKLGTGLFYGSGHGAFEHLTNKTPLETFNFLAFPSTIALAYHFQAWSNQWIVPYIEGGVDVIPFAEIRDDNKAPKFGGAATAHTAAGVELNLTAFSREARLSLDREYGINRIYIVLEARQLIKLANQFDFSGTVYNGGFLFEF